jgi:hypothetical protein
MGNIKTDYNKLLEASDSYYYGVLKIHDAEQLELFLKENKSWVLKMMDWEEIVNNTQGDQK